MNSFQPRFDGEEVLRDQSFPFQGDEDDGFMPSFSLTEDPPERVLQFFDSWGFVVIRDVIPSEQCEAAIAEFWQRAGLSPEDPGTWEAYWDKHLLSPLGIIGAHPELFMPSLLQMRQNPLVYQVYSLLYDTSHLWVDHDRLGVMRPTVGVRFDPQRDEATQPCDMPEWETYSNWLHLDVNPARGFTDIIGSFEPTKEGQPLNFLENRYLQGFVALSDARRIDGGFHCLPGSHKLVGLYQQLDAMDPGAHLGNIQIGDRSSRSHPLWEYVRQVPVRAGSMVIWNMLTLHGNYPNASDRFRFVHYLRMLPPGRGFQPLLNYDLACLPIQLSELGSKLFGWKSW